MVVRRWSWLGRALPMVVILTLLWSVRSSDEIWFMLWVVIVRYMCIELLYALSCEL